MSGYVKVGIAMLAWLAGFLPPRRMVRVAVAVLWVSILSNLGLLPPSARAQSTLGLATLQVALWPEFDEPRTLVILDGTLPPGTPLPAQLSLRIPLMAGAPHAVAYVGADGNLLTASYTTKPAGDDIIVSFAADSLSFRLEYYDPSLVTTGPARMYAFDWTTDYAVAAAALRVQQPFGAVDFSAEPALLDAGTGEYGLRYWETSLGALAAGQEVAMALRYTKPDSTLSADALGLTSATVAAETGAVVATNGSRLPLILAATLLGVALVGAGIFAYARAARPARGRAARARRQRRSSGRAPAAANRPANPPARRSVPVPPSGQAVRSAQARPANVAALDDGSAFCTQCGQRRQPGDRFCRQCGAAVAD